MKKGLIAVMNAETPSEPSNKRDRPRQPNETMIDCRDNCRQNQEHSDKIGGGSHATNDITRRGLVETRASARPRPARRLISTGTTGTVGDRCAG